MIPQNLGQYDIDVSELMFYQYYPIKVPQSWGLSIPEERLQSFLPLIEACIDDYTTCFGFTKLYNSFIYLTTKHLYQHISPINRPGWHIDGFGSDDEINYIWSSVNPTIFNSGPFSLSKDCQKSMINMTNQVDENKNYSYPNNSLLRLNTTIVHKPNDIEFCGYRIFFKMTFSSHPFDLIGNSINHDLKEEHPPLVRRRSNERNKPA